LDGLDWTSPDDSNKNSSNSVNQQSNTFSFTSGSSSNYPIDNIPSSLNEDLLKEKVDEVIKVRNSYIIFKKIKFYLHPYPIEMDIWCK
jgi:hypothetical protein